ncbi:hypothetical protein E3P89_02410 [Wallemia ichthyophaga]|uniref:Zn(2)-C6 fungal-type domain-containing protein n=1 Tax=Wallemia ichthyophaga TaxID=245174 RepID=A0A4T0F0V6_WALIC|nr:hypothetical protein E3P98_02343 [Wallemia ichthyophaga]TIB11273.1 hypothetical protein E3P90_02553 [Wallemia ichthyophaga]TIB12016.1 hypothetical protein E3P93_02450 [Wallemia ichthyophaga]TIB21764.1 hypothetical protein E3P89_02410 [Wallemia ichthyophaga]TIB23449.1 hypothetical protein E3P88_02572 [Wallemia ichthyophaga]
MNTNISTDKKPKILRACDGCRKRKARCDGPQRYPLPCSNCRNEDCTYENPAEKKGYSVHYVRDLEAKVRRYESILAQLSSEYTAEDSPSSDYSTQQKRKFDGPIASTSSRQPNFVSPTDNDKLDKEMALKIGCMFLAPESEPGKVTDVRHPFNRRFYGKSSLRGLVERVNLYTGATPDTLLSGKRRAYWREDWDRELLPQFTKPDYTHEDFGNEQLMYELVNMYFRKVNMSLPILDQTHFVAQIPARKLEREFGSLLMMVCAVGSQYMKADDERVLPPGRPDPLFAGHAFFEIAKTKMKDFTVSVATIEDIQALILLQTFLKASVYPKSSFIIHAYTIMHAQDIGLHCDWFSYTDNSHQREARRRTIWALFLADVAAAAALGRNQLLPDLSIEVDRPSAGGYGENDYKSRLSVVYMNKLIDLYKLLASILESIYRLKKDTTQGDFKMSLSDIAALNSRLNEWLNDMPTELRGDSEEDEEIVQLRSNIKLGFFVTQIFVYKTFLPNPQSTEESNFRLTSLVICGNAARSIISIYKKLLLDKPSEFGICPYDISNWSAFSATIVLIISFCEGRKKGIFNSNDLEYIHIGISNLRARESKDMLSGRAVDILLQTVRSADLPMDKAFMRTQADLSRDTGGLKSEHFSVPEVQDGSEIYEQEAIYQNDLNFSDMMQQMQVDSLDSNFFGDEDLDGILPSLDSTSGDHWSGLLSTMFNGSQFV